MIIFSGLDSGPVKVGYLEDPIIRALNLVGVWSARQGIDVSITSMNDKAHSAKSLHYEDKAVDLQVQPQSTVPSAKTKDAMRELSNYLRGNLELGWDVVFDSPGHYTHIHVEWDIRHRDAPNSRRA